MKTVACNELMSSLKSKGLVYQITWFVFVQLLW